MSCRYWEPVFKNSALCRKTDFIDRCKCGGDQSKCDFPDKRQKTVEEPKFGEWISVEDRLPETQKPVLVCAKDKTFGYKRVLKAAHVGYHECSTDDYEWQDYEGDTEYDEEKDCFWIPECWYETNAVEDNGNWMLYDDYDITHWMPLPEPPKEE